MCRRQYTAANISTNLYVISQPWLYSLAWCSGVHSVTTNAPQLLSAMSSPLFVMVTALLCSERFMWSIIIGTAAAKKDLTPFIPFF